jgi:hypothetical protein
MPEYYMEEYADMYFVYENIAERLLLLSEGMLMLVLGQTEDILTFIMIFFNTNTNKLSYTKIYESY